MAYGVRLPRKGLNLIVLVMVIVKFVGPLVLHPFEATNMLWVPVEDANVKKYKESQKFEKP